jgi:uroporphyrinogen III methyltransferase/synthase
MAAQGIVFVVGAGPALPGLLTVHAKELLGTADAVVYERRTQRKLIPGGVAGGPERFYVGARGKVRRASYGDVAQLLVTLARKEMRVVYLVHGDPLAFGRGTDLVTALHDASVEFEIVPGVSIGNVAAAYAGIPLLSPTMASATVFASGRDAAHGGNDTDWSAIARVGATVVVSNALAVLPAIIAGFVVAGVPGEIPAAAIVNAGRSSQRTIVATLGTISGEMAKASMTGAITMVIGWTVLLRDELSWFDVRPLFGVRIVVARSRYSPRAVVDRLRDLGAMVIELPPPHIARLDLDGLRDEIEQLSHYEWLVFASPDAVSIFWEHLISSGRDTRALAASKIACVDPATAGALLDRGVTVDVLQEKFEAVALIDALTERSDIPGAALLYLADDATAEPFGRDLEQAGAIVTSLALYREVPADKPRERLRRTLAERHASLVVAMSPAAAEEYLRAAGEHSVGSIPAAAYDSATGSVLRDSGVDVVIEPSRPGADGLVESVLLRLGTYRPNIL